MILGIDHGGTKTAAVVMDYKGNILGSETVYASDIGSAYTYTGLDKRVDYTMYAVKEAYGRALDRAGLKINSIHKVCAGLTGADWPEEYDLLHDALCKTTGLEDVLVVNDCIVAFWGCMEQRHGAVICMGTGLNVGLISPDGSIEALGWYIDKDCNGATTLGDKAVRAVVAAKVGAIAPTILTEVVLKMFNIQTVEELLRKYLNAQLQLTALAPHVMDAASNGDACAKEIVADIAKKAAKYVTGGFLRNNMNMQNPIVILSGSVLKNKCGLMKDTIAAVIHEDFPGAIIKDAEYEPVVGAALMALENMLGCEINKEAAENIRLSCEKYNLLRKRRDHETENF